jgi:5-formyltetrahydrofolate cyclo-ligase
MKAPPAMAAPQFPTDHIDIAKAAMRLSATARRMGQDPSLGAALTRHILQAAAFAPGAIIAGFWPIAGEIDIRPLLHALASRGHPIALPVTGRRGEPLVFRAWQPGAPLLPGRFGTSHPDGPETTPEVLLMPLLAFDSTGNRLGYGGGFYDRTATLLPRALRIGCAFAAQELDSLPIGPYDQTLHAIATETGFRTFPPLG